MDKNTLFLAAAVAVTCYGLSAKAQDPIEQSGDPARWYQPADTPQKKFETLKKEAGAALKEARDECRKTATDRRACEAQARGHLIHLRQGWIDGSGHDHGLAHLIEQSAMPLRRVLTNLARLSGDTPDGDAMLASFAERQAGLPASLITAILALDRGSPASRATGGRALVPRLGEYLAASERLWAYIDAWRAK